MTNQTHKDIGKAFADAAAKLDHCLEQARSRLALDGVSVEDRSSRFGRDSYYLWSFHFERRTAQGPEIVAASAEISYLEPWTSEVSREVKIRWLAEIFQTGQLSRFKRDKTSKQLLDDFIQEDMATRIHDLIHEAERVLTYAA